MFKSSKYFNGTIAYIHFMWIKNKFLSGDQITRDYCIRDPVHEHPFRYMHITMTCIPEFGLVNYLDPNVKPKNIL